MHLSLPLPLPFPLRLPSLRPLPLRLPNLTDLLPPTWLAVPKKKRSKQKVRQHQTGKSLTPTTSLARCKFCKNAKETHTICPHCLGLVKEQWRKIAEAWRTPNEIEEEWERKERKILKAQGEVPSVVDRKMEEMKEIRKREEEGTQV